MQAARLRWLALGLVLACGSRTGLLDEDPQPLADGGADGAALPDATVPPPGRDGSSPTDAMGPTIDGALPDAARPDADAGGFDGGRWDASDDGGADAGGPDGGEPDGSPGWDSGVDGGWEFPTDAGSDGGEDAGEDSGEDAGSDAEVDSGVDAASEPDGGAVDDAGVDADVDASLPPIDAGSVGDADADTEDCPNPEGTLIYVVSDRWELLSYAPLSNRFRTVGPIKCPAGTATPYSMAVDRSGMAYVLYNDGAIFRVSTADAACEATPFVKGQSGFGTFGMGFAANGGTTGGETLYIASSSAAKLGSIDLSTYRVQVLGTFVPAISQAELTGTKDGRLFALFTDGTPSVSIGEIEKSTARVLAQNKVAGTTLGSGWAFAFWGGNFYLFTAPGGSTVVTRYSPADGTATRVTRFGGPGVIVGAGVSTCAPFR